MILLIDYNNLGPNSGKGEDGEERIRNKHYIYLDFMIQSYNLKLKC